tara:strand:+ start:233 stop:502 length:270 start_codon:yes stop_codon:yes gene_type:complete
MEFKVLEESKKRMTFQLRGEGHAFCNALIHELQEVKGVSIASYKIDHPLVGIPEFLVETTSIEPRDALKQAVSALKKEAKSFAKDAAKL